MQFLKNNYEKIILGVVLLSVAAISLLLTLRAGDERQKLDEQLQKKVATSQKPVKPVDLVASAEVLEHIAGSVTVQLAGDHRTFNPGIWIRKADGTIIPVADNGQKGARGLTLTATRSVNLSVTYNLVAGSGEPFRYQFSIVRDHERNPAKRRPSTVSLSEGGKNDLFVLREIHGPKDNPTEMIIEFLAGAEKVTLVKDKPFAKGLAYAADFRYEVENKNFTNKRQDDTFSLSGVLHKVVAISQDEAVVSAPNFVRTTIKLSSAP